MMAAIQLAQEIAEAERQIAEIKAAYMISRRAAEHKADADNAAEKTAVEQKAVIDKQLKQYKDAVFEAVAGAKRAAKAKAAEQKKAFEDARAKKASAKKNLLEYKVLLHMHTLFVHEHDF